MKRRTFWIFDSIMYLLASIFSFLTAIKSEGGWFRGVEFFLFGMYLFLGISYLIRAQPFRIKKITIETEEDDDE